ncbi:putative SNAP25 homologous protein SNAP30 [Bidens hawaiensis]|uniref:putative SNAP25 homologous protein SNAP30 n=1 Tax=Bidens hawaiensis TaxID=980011 RepID=UPI00404A7992
MFGFKKNKEPETHDKKHAPAKATGFDDDDDDYFGQAKTTTLKKKPKEELDNMSTQELENYAVDQAEETTKSVNNCLKIAEDIREDANKTLDTLHAQGDQIHRTHEKAAEMDKDLSKGEKILGNLGGMFSMTWKPKKGKEIKGPDSKGLYSMSHFLCINFKLRSRFGLCFISEIILIKGQSVPKLTVLTSYPTCLIAPFCNTYIIINAMNFVSLDDGKAGKKASKKDREKLGLDQSNKGKKASKAAASGEPKDAMQKVDLEKAKQDDALDDLSDVLGDLKGMANEMGSELDKQNKALDDFSEDVDELNSRVKGANTRARKLIAK